MSFDVTGVSDTWNSIQSEIIDNISINSYSYYETKSTSKNGGVGLNVKNSLVSKLRPYLNFNCNSFEIVWFELDNKNAKSFVIGCVYKHLSSDILLEYFTSIFPKLTNKILFKRDFNIDLLKYSSNKPVEDSMNALFVPTAFHV